jgi:hypothetical protein
MAQVTEAEATAWVATECQATTQPCLDAEEIAHLVRGARRPDADGLKPSDAAWVPTYDLAWAAWKGWTMKAGKAVLFTDVSAPGGLSVSKSQVRAACMDQANLYARGVLQASPIRPDVDTTWAYTLAVPGTTPGQGSHVNPDIRDTMDQDDE